MRAMSWAQALELGLMDDYSANAPLGEWAAILDTKAWGKSECLHCFFTEIGTGKKYRLTAFRPDNAVNAYRPKDKGIDFSEKNIDGRKYRLVTGMNTQGTKSVWLSAEPSSDFD